MIIVATATHKTKNMFFFLVQTEQGDIFKITLTHDADMGMVREEEYSEKNNDAFII